MEILSSKTARTPSTSTPVLNSECAYSFHSPFTSTSGILVNLSNFVGFHPDAVKVQPQLIESGVCYLRIVKRKELKAPESTEPSSTEQESQYQQQPTKLALGKEGGFKSDEDKYDVISTYSMVAFDTDGNVAAELPYDDTTKSSYPAYIVESADGVISHTGLVMQQDVKEWELDEDPKPVSKYASSLEFVDNGVQISPDASTWKCAKSGDTDNLWLNLSDGFIGGGRKFWDGSGGSNGALDHFLETGEKYPLVVKLGTITSDVTSADCYSYAKDEDGPVLIPNLADLLAKRGINVAAMKKTDKSIAEMEVELNATYAFDAITEESEALTPVHGPGLQGLQNLGNSCNIKSVAQALFSGTIRELSSRYGVPSTGDVFDQPLLCTTSTDATNDLLCQTAKLATALTSGKYVSPSTDDTEIRIAPRMFKHVVGCNHIDFKTGQQQDAAQYMQFFLESLDRAEKGAGSRLKNKDDESAGIPISSSLFAYKTVDRLECSADNRVKYREGAAETVLTLRVPMEAATIIDTETPSQKRPKNEDSDAPSSDTKESVPTVSMKACIDAWAATSEVDDYRWPHMENNVHPGSVYSRMSNFPRYLVVQVQRYTIGDDWVPKKLEVNIDTPEEIDLSYIKNTGPKDGELLVPEEAEKPKDNKPAGPVVDEGALGQLMDMGFSMNGCMRALTTVGGSNIEAAMTWIFEHNQDPDFNDPLPESGPGGASQAPASGSEVDEAVLMSLVENLGCFTSDQVRAALKQTGGAADRAADWLFSHMDDLDGAIAALESSSSSNAADQAVSNSNQVLEDGDGKYVLTGMISHIGRNTNSGHYVCHLKKDGKWVIFNDEKVALSKSPPFQHTYMYLFQRADTIGSSPNLVF